MAIYKAFSPEVEMLGQPIIGFIEGMGAFSSIGKDFLRKRGIVNPQPDQWYPQQSFLDTFRDIASQTGPMTVIQTGRRIIEVAVFPPGVNSFEIALEVTDQSYQMNHRGGYAGKYEFARTGARAGKMVCTVPYPDEWDIGLFRGYATKFGVAAARISVDESQPTRNLGAHSTTFLLSW